MSHSISDTLTSTTFVHSILRGIGQVMFQNNAFSGLLFLLGILYNSPIMALGAVLGTAVSTLFARYIRYSQEEIENGLYGFNGALVGIAVWFFFEVSLISTLAMISGAVLSTVIMHEMKKRIPAYTAPFILATWIVILIIKFLNLSPFIQAALIEQELPDIFSAVSMGLGQVMFQGNLITGLIFLSAIVVNSRIAAVYAVYGSLFGYFMALLFSFPVTSINLGIWGYNAILCAIALGDKKQRGFLLATLAVILSVWLNLAMDKMGIIALTAPFVLATWIILLLSRIASKMNNKNGKMNLS